MGQMTTRQKTILYNLILIQVMKRMPIARGSGKSLLYWDNLWRYHAFKQTEYCLAAGANFQSHKPTKYEEK